MVKRASCPVTIDFEGISIAVTRKRVRRISLVVRRHDASVRMSVPYATDMDAVLAFLRQRADWLVRTRKRCLEQHRPGLPDCVDGEMLHVLGVSRSLSIICGERAAPQVEADGSQVRLYALPDYPVEACRRQIHDWASGLLHDFVVRRIAHWSSVTGYVPSSVSLDACRSRWGVCRIKTGAISFSSRLAWQNAELVDYVVLHEIAHLKVPNHGSDFRAFMDEYMPDWRIRRRRLNFGE